MPVIKKTGDWPNLSNLPAKPMHGVDVNEVHTSSPGKKCPSYGFNTMDGQFSYLVHYQPLALDVSRSPYTFDHTHDAEFYCDCVK